MVALYLAFSILLPLTVILIVLSIISVRKLSKTLDRKKEDLAKLQKLFHEEERKYHDLLSEKVTEVKLKNIYRDVLHEIKKTLISLEKEEKKHL